MIKMHLEEVLERMEEETANYGFRGASERDLSLMETGDHLEASLDIWDARDCDYDENAEKLEGTSAIAINEYMDLAELKNRFSLAMGYAQNHHKTNTVLFVSGDNSEYGDDEKETVLRDDFEKGAKIIAEVVL